MDAGRPIKADVPVVRHRLEAGCEWITTDRGFARYQDLRWRHPLDA